MKKILLLSLFVFFGCSKDDSSSSQNLIDKLDGKVFDYYGNDDSTILIIDKSNKYVPITKGYKHNVLGYECRKNDYFNKDIEGRFIRKEVVINNESRYEVHNYIGSYSDSTVEVKVISIITSSTDLQSLNYQYYEKIGDDTIDGSNRFYPINTSIEAGSIICSSYYDD